MDQALGRFALLWALINSDHLKHKFKLTLFSRNQCPKKMNIWRDKTFGKHGAWIWISGLGPIVLTTIFVVIALTAKHLSDVLVFGMIVLPPCAWGSFYILQVRTVLQEIVKDGSRFRGKCFYGREIDLEVSNIKSMSYYPMTWKIRQINLFDRKIPGINLELQDGTIIRINSRIEAFPQLVEALKEFAKLSGQIVCNL